MFFYSYQNTQHYKESNVVCFSIDFKVIIFIFSPFALQNGHNSEPLFLETCFCVIQQLDIFYALSDWSNMKLSTFLPQVNASLA